MGDGANISPLVDRLKKYKRKYYVNLLLRGSLISSTILVSLYLIFSTLEFTLRFNSPIRALLFFGFLIALGLVLYFWVVIPLLKLIDNRRQINDEIAARQIGRYFPQIGDKLLNTIQLNNNSDGEKQFNNRQY